MTFSFICCPAYIAIPVPKHPYKRTVIPKAGYVAVTSLLWITIFISGIWGLWLHFFTYLSFTVFASRRRSVSQVLTSSSHPDSGVDIHLSTWPTKLSNTRRAFRFIADKHADYPVQRGNSDFPDFQPFLPHPLSSFHISGYIQFSCLRSAQTQRLRRREAATRH
ncbi:hypothetical protein BDQ12DRAFT_242247 [Crucibulum laeve]|uniref:Uncharacterized protein n=1 Tax=Crucibulum laeve TaxID=68775 RepID=A0A5C3LTH0_9AGAR|nr:hypothetical protein BDQ12DRAFT_242247 [Crucibulum laeve]